MIFVPPPYVQRPLTSGLGSWTAFLHVVLEMGGDEIISPAECQSTWSLNAQAEVSREKDKRVVNKMTETMTVMHLPFPVYHL